MHLNESNEAVALHANSVSVSCIILTVSRTNLSHDATHDAPRMHADSDLQLATQGVGHAISGRKHVLGKFQHVSGIFVEGFLQKACKTSN